MVSRQKAKKQWLLAVFVYIIWITAVIMLRELTTLPPYVAYFFLPLAVIPLLIADYRLARAKHLGLAKTVRKKTKELSIALLHAEEARKAQSEFLAHMSHELRTPLNAIMGFSAATAREAFGPIGNPIYKEYADKLVDLGGAHYCFCSEEELEAQRKACEEAGIPFKFRDPCKKLSVEEARKRIAAGEKYTVRHRCGIPDSGKVKEGWKEQWVLNSIFLCSGSGFFILFWYQHPDL